MLLFNLYDFAKLDVPENKNAKTGQASAIVYAIGPNKKLLFL